MSATPPTSPEDVKVDPIIKDSTLFTPMTSNLTAGDHTVTEDIKEDAKKSSTILTSSDIIYPPQQDSAAIEPHLSPKKLAESKNFITFVVFLGVFVDLCVYAIVIPFVPVLVEEYGGSSTDVGVLLAKDPMIICLAGLFASTVFFAVAKGYWALLIARFLQGASCTGVWVLGLALVADTYSDDEAGLGKAMGYVLIGYTLGQLAGGALFKWNRYSPYVFCGVLIIIDLIGRLLVIDPVKPKVRNVDDPKPTGFWELCKKCPSVGLTFLALIVPSVVAGPVAGYFYDKYGARWVMIPSLFITSILLFPLCFGNNLPWLIIGLFLFGMIFTFGLTPLLPEIANAVPRDAYAKAYSLFNMAFSAGILGGPYFAAYIYEHHGWFWEMITLGCLSLVAAIFSIFYKDSKPQSNHKPSEESTASV
ncbi:major facilitator superfamily domain-containing protein [Chytridium lagenaria]|nr:major facilitator superfamily domain-containing protein [Chytridium lagenaria]